MVGISSQVTTERAFKTPTNKILYNGAEGANGHGQRGERKANLIARCMTTNRNEIITALSEPVSGLESNSEYVFISSLSNLYNYIIIICHASCVPGHFLTIQEIGRLRPDHPMVMLRPPGGQVCHPAADSDPDALDKRCRGNPFHFVFGYASYLRHTS